MSANTVLQLAAILRRLTAATLYRSRPQTILPYWSHDSVAFMRPLWHCQCVTVLTCLETVTTSTAWPAVYPMQWASGARMRLCRCGTSELLSSASLMTRVQILTPTAITEKLQYSLITGRSATLNSLSNYFLYPIIIIIIIIFSLLFQAEAHRKHTQTFKKREKKDKEQ